MATQITLPKDAEGKEVPLDTELLYDEYGNQRRIMKFIYHHDCETGAEEWTVEYDNGVERFVSVMYLTQPDSWKKLEEDLGRVIERIERNYAFCSMACTYTNRDENAACNDCKFYNSRGRCLDQMIVDIASRIHNLRNKD